MLDCCDVIMLVVMAMQKNKEEGGEGEEEKERGQWWEKKSSGGFRCEITLIHTFSNPNPSKPTLQRLWTVILDGQFHTAA